MKKIVALTETQLGLLVENKETFEKLHVGGMSSRQYPLLHSPFLSSHIIFLLKQQKIQVS